MALLRRFEVKTLVLFLGLTLLSCRTNAIRGVNDHNVFDVTKFGARADGKTDSSAGFMKAWHAACETKGGDLTVLIPGGVYIATEVLFHGPCEANTLTLDVQGSVMADTDLSNYPNGVWISFNLVNGLTIKGKGMFDAQGKSVWPYFSCGPDGKCDNSLPPSFTFEMVHNSVIDGLTSRNSMGYNIKIVDSGNITFQNMHLFAPMNSPHTDGIHVAQSMDINVVSADIESGGACIFIADGSEVSVDHKGVACREPH